MVFFDLKVYFKERFRKLQVPPLVFGCLFFILGIVFQKCLSLSPLMLLAGIILGIGGILFFFNRRPGFEIFLGSIIFLTGALSLAGQELVAQNSLSRLLTHGSVAVVLKGRIISESSRNEERHSFVLRASSLIQQAREWSVSGDVSVRFFKPQPCWYGEEVLVQGRLYRYRGRLMMRLKNDPKVFIRSGRRPTMSSKVFIIRLKQRMQRVFNATLAPFYASILSAMVLGDGRQLVPSIKDMMIKTGTWHVVVVSGSHTVFVAFILSVFLKIVRLPRVGRIVLVMGLLLVYCFITGACAPVVRATVMTEALCLSYLIKRQPVFLNSLCLAAWVILIFDPRQLFNIGFELSFLSVYFIVALSSSIRAFLLARLPKNRVFNFVATGFSISLSAWLGTAPLLAYVFGQVSFIAVAANMAIVPLATLVVAAGFTLLMLGGFIPWLAAPLSAGTEFLVNVFLGSNYFLSLCPWSCLNTFKIPLILMVFFYSLLAFFIFFLPVRDTS